MIRRLRWPLRLAWLNLRVWWTGPAAARIRRELHIGLGVGSVLVVTAGVAVTFLPVLLGGR